FRLWLWKSAMEMSTVSSNRLGSAFCVQTVVLVSALVLTVLIAAGLAKDPDQVRGYEAYLIAKSLAEGHGYGFRIGIEACGQARSPQCCCLLPKDGDCPPS